jgi:hypothetical protein
MLGDQIVEQDLDIVRETGAPRTSLVREYPNVMLRDELTISFKAKQGKPIISGVEIVRRQ